jgi:hypothetical protein
LKKSMTNIASEYRSANIVRDHATILPDDATPTPDGIFGKDRLGRHHLSPATLEMAVLKSRCDNLSVGAW